MPRKAFVADLQTAQATELPSDFHSLRPGDEDGSFNLSYKTPGFGSQLIHLQAQVSDVGDYPSAHNWFVYSTSDNVPKYIDDLLSDPSVFDGLKVPVLIQRVAKKFGDHTRGSLHNPVNLDSDEDDLLDDGFDDEDQHEPEDNQDDEDDYDDDFDDHFGMTDYASQQHAVSVGLTSAGLHATDEATRDYNAAIREDLRRLKTAGLRVSCCTSPFGFARDFYLTASCRIAKLHISDDALAAWGLQREKYILLILHYTDGWKSFEEVMAEAKHGRYTMSFRVAVSTKRKSPRQDTIDAFATAYDSKPSTNADEESGFHNQGEGFLEKFFIDRPLNELMNGRFVDVARFRQEHNLSWDGAERFCQDNQAMGRIAIDVEADYFRPEPVPWRTKPALRIDDHLANGGHQRSFPLVAMEFLLRHFAQCTDFCLVCHTRLESKFEALRPYVCDKPLCLYQYMALGFGPSMEHEILTQPYVVDLLASFCHARAAAGKLDDLPIGMGLSVPEPDLLPAIQAVGTPQYPQYGPGMPSQMVPPAIVKSGKLRVKYDETRRQITFDHAGVNPGLKVGDWIVLEYEKETAFDPKQIKVQRKIVEAWYPVYKLTPGREELTLDKTFPTQPVTPAETGLDATIYSYTLKFDDQDKSRQQRLICALLNELPSVREMRKALSASRNKTLAQLFTDVSPAALGVLRWVIASNRSCIVAIDDPCSGTVNSDERVYGMPGYMQFRFAQGAPDKERRFMDAVQQTQTRLKTKIPTLWAWHGSDVSNWHSIIREGLHFKSIANGRAYGDGIYNAMDANTSVGYTSGRGISTAGGKRTTWLNSELNLTCALSLNEIVNAPAEFQSKSPYLVVQHTDWVQTRILFVACSLDQENRRHLDDGATGKPTEILEQDKTYFPKGLHAGVALSIPANAISASRRNQLGYANKGLKKLKIFGTSSKSSEDIEELFSDESDVEDRALFEEPPEVVRTRAVVRPTAVTDFVPGSLEVSKLPCLPSPPYATPQASRALTRALKELQKMQHATPTAELGWHLCEDALDNIYQWIVELHTFDKDLPLYQDLKAKNLTSVVLELRFGPSYPYSPPFVRVIRPRFLGFQQGGGGHVTAGGALCMELLTNDGWSAVSSIEAVLLQVKMAISSTEPKPARLAPGTVAEYGAGEAIEAYKRACMVHGWKVPPDFQQIASAGASAGLGGRFAQQRGIY